MRRKRINLLKLYLYRDMLIELKKIELNNKISQEIENRMSTVVDNPKILILKRNK